MSYAKQRTAWVEGMLMEPQHFQQQERFFEHSIHQRMKSLHRFWWGFQEIEIDSGLLEQGKIALKKARGVFPDGTPFHLPQDGPLPLALDTDEHCAGKAFCLTLPMDMPGAAWLDLYRQHNRTRFETVDAEVVDRNLGASPEGTPRTVILQLARLSCRLQFAENISSVETALPVGAIVERKADGRVVLDDEILPPLLDFHASPWLVAAVTELAGLIGQRLESVFRTDVPAAIGGLSELLELLLLQLLSEYHLRIQHLLANPQTHPEELWQTLLGLLGRLSIIPDGERLWQRSDLQYRHNALQSGYLPLLRAIRRALSLVIEAPAVALNFIPRGDNIFICQNDAQLRLEKVVFAISSALPADMLRSYFPVQVKLGPVEKISQLIDLQLPGVRLIAMSAPPRHVPYYPNSTYFEVDNADPLCREMMAGSAMALSIVGDFPDLRFDAWGLRRGRVG